MESHPILADGALRVEVHPSIEAAFERWRPLLPAGTGRGGEAFVLRLLPAEGPAPPAPAAPRVASMGRVRAWVEGSGAELRGDAVHGSLALGAGTGSIHLRLTGDRGKDDRAGWELFAALTLAAAFLLGRLGRALAHAAAAAPEGGGAWLLVGDSHAGKTTTTANLVRAGWRYLSDDNVVLRRGAGAEIEVEGWPRRFHLDEGWEGGETLQRRGETDPRERFPGRWLRSAPLAGLLFPRVEAELPTVLEPVTSADALAALVRQSPWLLTDAGAAPALLSLLRAAALLPARRLRLGRDAYADPAVLLRALAPLAG